MLKDYIRRGLQIQGAESFYNALISLLTVLVIGNYLSPEIFGVYTALFVFIGIISEISDLGFKNIIIREQSSDIRIRSFLFFLLVISFLMILVYEIFLFYLLDNNYLFSEEGIFSENDLGYAQFFGILIIPLTLNNYFTAVFRKELEFAFVSLIRSISITIVFVLTVILTIRYQDYWGLLIGLTSGEFLKLFTYIVKWKYRFRKINSNLLDEARNSFGIYLAHLFGFFARNIDYLIISSILSIKEVGIYAMAYKLMQAPVKQIGGVLNKVMFPVYGKMDSDEEIRKTFKYTICTVFFYSTIIFSILASTSYLIIDIFFSDDWSDVGYILSIISIAGVFLLIHNACEPLLKTLASQRWLVMRQIMYFILIVTFVYTGALYGIFWAVIGVVFSLFITSLMSLTMAFSTLKENYTNFFKSLLKLMVVSVLILTTNFILTEPLEHLDNFVKLVLIVALDLSIAYFSILYIKSLKKSSISEALYIP